MASNAKIPPDKGGDVAENDKMNSVSCGAARLDPSKDVGGSGAMVAPNDADGKVTLLGLQDCRPISDGHKLNGRAGTAAVSFDGGDRVQSSPRGVRRVLVDRISELRQGHAEQIADMVLGGVCVKL